MRLDQLRSPKEGRRRRKRVGRGDGSGHGSYSGRGIKGQKARSGGGTRPGFEGGQLPIVQRLPSQRGFVNIFKKSYATVNLDALNDRFSGNSEVTPEAMKEVRLVRSLKQPIKVLGRGELDRALVVKAHKFSRDAKRKIEAVGGKAVEV